MPLEQTTTHLPGATPDEEVAKDSRVAVPPPPPITIIEAGKSTEGASRGYIAYTIKYGSSLVRRRYSEFEALRNVLTHIFPLLVIPPIPGKSFSLKLLASPLSSPPGSTPATPAPESKLIDHRKKMLQLFLQECLKSHPVREAEIFCDFLNPKASFADTFREATLPADPLCANPFNTLKTPENILYSYLPRLATHPVLTDMEALHLQPGAPAPLASGYPHLDRYARIVREADLAFAGDFDTANKKITKTAARLAALATEAATVFGAWGLAESVRAQTTFSALAERMGTTLNETHLVLVAFVEFVGTQFNDEWKFHLQCFGTIKDVLAFREAKLRQRDQLRRSLSHEEATWDRFRASEPQAHRLSQAISRADRSVSRSRPVCEVPFAPITTPNPSPPKISAFAYPFLAFGKLKTTLTDAMGPPVEPSREEQTTLLQSQINILRQCLALAETDLAAMDLFVELELEQYHREKVVFMKEMLHAYSVHLVEVNQKSLEIWLEAKQDLEALDL